MTLYFLRVANGPYEGQPDEGSEYVDLHLAWTDIRNVCGDLAGDVFRRLEPNTDWQLELLNEAKMTVFRIRLVAEALK